MQQDQEFADDVSEALAARIREILAQRRISRQKLADDARISLSTLEKALNGSRSFTRATVVRLEEALGMVLRPAQRLAGTRARKDLGAYSPESVGWLEGDYLTLRPSFGVKEAVYAYHTAITWNTAADCLTFEEFERADANFSQKGAVSVPSKSGHIYLHTNEDGQHRLAVLGRPTISGEMYGVLTTLLVGTGTQLVPVSAPLALVPLRGEPDFGRISPGSKSYETYRAHLVRAVSEDYAKLMNL